MRRNENSVSDGLKFKVNMDNEFKIFFEKLSMAGLEEMHRYSVDERLYEFFEFAPFKKIEDTKKYIEKLLQRMSMEDEDATAKYWFVCCR